MGPAPKLISAMTLSGTEPPLAVGTGRFSIVDRLRREPSVRATRIGTCRSDSEKRALFWSISPWVATRIAWLSAAVVTPMSAIRSSRGVIDDLGPAQIAGDARRAQLRPLAHLLDQLERGALELGRVGAGEQHRNVAAADAVLVAEGDARIGDVAELGRDLALELGAGALAAFAAILQRHDRCWRCRRGRDSNADATSGCARITSAARLETTRV